MKKLPTLDELDARGKRILVRVDINSPVDKASGKIMDNPRIREHAKTLKELVEKGAKVVAIAHQGRKGKEDFLSLEQHATLLSRYVGSEVRFVGDIIGDEAKEAISSLREGDCLLLENLRFLDEETEKKSPEEHAKGKLVTTLAPLFDAFVQDAFSALHRAHASLVGFPSVLPTFIGRVMERELKACERVVAPEEPLVGVFGGAKVEECMKVMRHMFEEGKLAKALVCGLTGNLFLLANGVKVNEDNEAMLEKKGALEFVAEAKQLLETYGERIVLPVDLAFEVDGERREYGISNLPERGLAGDVGSETIKLFSETLEEARTIIAKGPAGIYEMDVFMQGTRKLLEKISRCEAFSLIGGGDLTTALEKVGIPWERFSHVSLAGGALITYLSGEELPGLKVLGYYQASER